ncbi:MULTISPECIES: metal ABC transporter solute-binding protein, Zn/Mn family [unclassified Curtobacterium]|uniref:metal ABC transporter solute-binding protein, Zn/Mn family n=1 Tax=unclassified Curtobacterium TaxID=257496 RepID=UPI0008DD164F|nr:MULTISPECIES: zinc ABC transporter substrate-binding protein [unclassified Curtobacterium]WIA97263.1 zinc ABC transporter substrate-binding protein [Curtobacterium sp. MCBA15_004]WIB00580.1 zinc ABC transporter substrate-binding protein [Curtobacterium sp. MCBA15_012]
MTSRLLALPLIAGAAALALTGCATSSASGNASDDGTVRVVASTNVYGSIVQSVGGKDVEVTSILSDPSQDPHSFESSAKTQLAVSKADLLVENGGGYDDFMTTLAKASGTKAATIDVAELSGLDHGGEFNEHVFYDYPTMVKLVAEVQQRLTKLDSAQADTFETNAKALTAKLDDLESQTAAAKAKVDGEKVAYTEPVPGYLFDAMGLDNVTPEKFSEAIEEGDDVPPAALNETLQLFRDKTVRMLAYNEQTSSPETEQVKQAADQAGIPVVGVTETLPKGEDYVSWQQANIDAIQAALTK